MTHKHAEFFIAIANGESPDDWEYKQREWDKDKYHSAGLYLSIITLSPDHCEVRRKQKTHIVNGFTVPAPGDAGNPTPAASAMLEALVKALPEIDCSTHSGDSAWNAVRSAIAKAMCGINPESDDE